MPTCHQQIVPWLHQSLDKAMDLWDQFETTMNQGAASPVVTSASLLAPSNGWQPNAAIRGLFRFCAKAHPDVSVARLQVNDLAMQSHNRPVGRAVGWLAVFPDRNKKLQVIVFIDWHYLQM